MAPLMLIAGVVALTAFLVWFGWRVRHDAATRAKTGSGGSVSGLVGSMTDVFHPDAAMAREELDAQQHYVVPAPTPDRDLESGRIRIELP